MRLTLSVRSFQTPPTSMVTAAAWPSLPSVPTSRATRVTSEMNPLSWSTMALMVFFSSRFTTRAGRICENPSRAVPLDQPGRGRRSERPLPGRPLGDRAARAGLPHGTLIVNATGSLLVGLLMGALTQRTGADAAARLLLVVGFCGAYTTFSTFSFETIALLREGALATALGYVLASVALSLLGTAVGLGAARLI